jgi:hypothetical protein
MMFSEGTGMPSAHDWSRRVRSLVAEIAIEAEEHAPLRRDDFGIQALKK